MTAVNPQMQALQTQSIAEQRQKVDEALGDLRKALDAPLSNRDWLMKIANEVEQDPSRWAQGANALTADGEKRFQGAVFWCAVGFSLRDFDKLPYSISRVLAEAAGVTVQDYGIHIVDYNDCSISSANEFVSWFRRAAELCT